MSKLSHRRIIENYNQLIAIKHQQQIARMFVLCFESNYSMLPSLLHSDEGQALCAAKEYPPPCKPIPFQ